MVWGRVMADKDTGAPAQGACRGRPLADWRPLDSRLGFGVGVALGPATVGRIGYGYLYAQFGAQLRIGRLHRIRCLDHLGVTLAVALRASGVATSVVYAAYGSWAAQIVGRAPGALSLRSAYPFCDSALWNTAVLPEGAFGGIPSSMPMEGINAHPMLY